MALVSDEQRANVHRCLRGYVPRPVLVSLDSKERNLWVAELRTVTTLFIKVNSGLTITSPDQLEEIQSVVVAVQEQISKYDGTLCRFIVDDKGIGFLVAFGLPPAMHEHDPLRALQMALGTVHSMFILRKKVR